MVSASCSTGQCAGGVVNRGADADISSAPTDVAIHGEIDVAVARILDFLEKRDCAHHLAGLAVPALRDFVGNPSLLYRTGLAMSAIALLNEIKNPSDRDRCCHSWRDRCRGR